ncbi:MAG: tRNA lysidine(34) synthetase TilS [Planctomycetota bacterium]|jgi:tRNA(Ile)-lysidine synthase
MNLLKKAYLTIDGYDLIRPGETILCAVSGGPDSVCLACVLKEINDIQQLDWKIHIAHYNHGLRSSASDDDEEFSREMAKRMKAPFHIERGNVRKKKQKERISLEEAARKARHEFLIRKAGEVGAQKIALAHNLDDQSETILHRIIRGTGLRGLKGMSPIRLISRKQDLFFVRPLIELERYEIEAYLRDKGVAYRTDLTNFDTSFTRNRIRHKLIPTIESEFNPRFKQALVKLGQTSASFYILLREIAGEVYENTRMLGGKDEVCFNIKEFSKLPPAIQTLIIDRAVQLLSGKTTYLNFEHYLDILSLCSEHGFSKVIRLPKRLEARRESYILKIYRAREAPKPIRFRRQKIKVPGRTVIKKLNLRIEAEFLEGKVVGLKDYIRNKEFTEEIIDVDKLSGPLEIRMRQEGDVFSPLGARGSCKLKKFFIDQKVPKALRDRIPIVIDQERIVWVVGYRIGEEYKITDGTKKLLRLKVKRLDGPGKE